MPYIDQEPVLQGPVGKVDIYRIDTKREGQREAVKPAPKFKIYHQGVTVTTHAPSAHKGLRMAVRIARLLDAEDEG